MVRWMLWLRWMVPRVTDGEVDVMVEVDGD